jgi:hypothetical protein
MSTTQERQLTNAEIERYKFYRLSHIDLDSARHALDVHRRYRRLDVRSCLMCAIVVSYARPFSVNRGELGKHELSPKLVPSTMRALHRELIDMRMRLFAHTDFSYRRPQLARFPSAGRPIFALGFAQLDYVGLDRRADSIRKLVLGVMDSLATEIARMEDRFESSQLRR